MMKFNFDQTGVSHLQTWVLSLTPHERHQLADTICSDFHGWMQDTFYLSSEQEGYLFNIPQDLVEELSSGLADSWENGIDVSFYKEEPEDDDRGAKEIIISPRVTGSLYASVAGNTIAKMCVTIRYTPDE